MGDDAQPTEVPELWPTDLTDECRVIDRLLKFLSNRHGVCGAGRDIGTEAMSDSESPKERSALESATVAACQRLTRFFRNDLLLAETR